MLLLTNNTYLLLGTNLGNRENNLRAVKNLIKKRCGYITAESSIYETAAWGFKEQPNFLNQIVQIETTKQPKHLLEIILNIEQEMGRVRTAKMGPRVIDIDILFMDNHNHYNTSQLTIPHPAIQDRKFVLEPLNELIPNYIHPVYNLSIHQLLLACTDNLDVKKFSSPAKP